MTEPIRDYVAWHSAYDDPDSRLSRRLRVVQRRLRESLDRREGPVRITSMCAGQARDVIPVLAEHRLRERATITLVEIDNQLAAVAERSAAAAGLRDVTVVRADAGTTDAYAAAGRADIFLACGVFGNIGDDDIRATIEALPMLCATGATVLWTRGRSTEHDLTPRIRGWFAAYGFDERSFDAPEGDTFRVGTARMVTEPAEFRRGVRLFTFLR